MKTMKKYLMTLVLMIAAMTMVTGLTSTTAFAKTKYSRYVVQYCKVKCKVNLDSYTKNFHYNLTLSGKWKNVPKSGITLKQKDIKLPKKHTIDDEISNSSFIALRLYDTKKVTRQEQEKAAQEPSIDKPTGASVGSLNLVEGGIRGAVYVYMNGLTQPTFPRYMECVLRM